MRIINSIKEAQAKANTALLTAALSIQSPFWSKSTDGRHVHNVSIYGTPFCPNRTGCMLVGIYKSQETDTSVWHETKWKIILHSVILDPWLFDRKKWKIIMHSVGFEPTSTNTMQLECTPLDRSGTNATIHHLPRTQHKLWDMTPTCYTSALVSSEWHYNTQQML